MNPPRFSRADDGLFTLVRYEVVGGWLVNTLLVRRDVERIFLYRQNKLQAVFA